MAKGLHDSGRSSFPLMKTSSMWGGVFKYKGIYKNPWSAWDTMVKTYIYIYIF